MRITWLVLVTMVALVFGCAAGDEGTGAGGGGGGRTTSTETTTNTGGSPGVGGSGGAGQGGQGGQGGSGGGLSGEIELCVLNEAEAYGICEMPEELDFGVVGSGTKETRMFRVDNETFDDVLFQQAEVSSTAFEITAVRFEEDPGNPGQYLRVEQSLPVTRASGQSLWFEVEYTATGNAGPLPSQNVVVEMNVDGNPVADLLVPITGEETGCPAGLGACDPAVHQVLAGAEAQRRDPRLGEREMVRAEEAAGLGMRVGRIAAAPLRGFLDEDVEQAELLVAAHGEVAGGPENAHHVGVDHARGLARRVERVGGIIFASEQPLLLGGDREEDH